MILDLRRIRDERARDALLQQDPHVRVTVEYWHMGGGRWWTQPCTTSRMGDLTPAAWELIGRAVADYGEELHRYSGAKREQRAPRRKRNRVRRGWR